MASVLHLKVNSLRMGEKELDCFKDMTDIQVLT